MEGCMFEKFDFGTGINYKYLDVQINPNTPLSKQVDCLKEDMLQINYQDHLTLDMGWYPEFSDEESFVVVIILNDDWENPLVKMECRDIFTLEQNLEECVSIIKSKTI